MLTWQVADLALVHVARALVVVGPRGEVGHHTQDGRRVYLRMGVPDSSVLYCLLLCTVLYCCVLLCAVLCCPRSLE